MATAKAKVSKTVSTSKQKAKASTKVAATKVIEHRPNSWASVRNTKVDMPGNGATITVLTKPDDTVYSKLEQASKLSLYRKLKSGMTLGSALEIDGLSKGQVKRFAQWGYIRFSKAG